MAEADGHKDQNLTQPTGSSRNDKSTTREKDFSRYKMDYPKKGLCLIINMKTFHPKLSQEPRLGTEKDADSLKNVFESIGFQVQIEKDATSDRICEVLNEVAEDDHSKRGCFICVVLSHGKEGGFYSYDDFMDEEYLFNIFKGENGNKGLFGKPKLFFFQVCRGTKYDTGVTPYSSSVVTPSCKIPKEADFLCHYSTPAGYFAFRDKDNGSWFIQSLCEMLEKYWKEHELVKILTRVNQKVAFEFESRGKKEMPCIVSKLTKELYL